MFCVYHETNYVYLDYFDSTELFLENLRYFGKFV